MSHSQLVQQLQYADAREEELAADVQHWHSKACSLQAELNTLKQQYANPLALLALLALLQLWQQWQQWGAEQHQASEQQELDSTVYAGQVWHCGTTCVAADPGCIMVNMIRMCLHESAQWASQLLLPSVFLWELGADVTIRAAHCYVCRAVIDGAQAALQVA